MVVIREALTVPGLTLRRCWCFPKETEGFRISLRMLIDLHHYQIERHVTCAFPFLPCMGGRLT